MKRYRYIGPDDIRSSALESATTSGGHAVRTPEDLGKMIDAEQGEPLTFVIDTTNTLRVAPRRSEHVACANGGEVLSAGELTAIRVRKKAKPSGGATIVVTDISNQSTGYCPEPESWPAVAKALDAAGIAHPGGFTYEVTFRRCPQCKERNLVKEGVFECALCNTPLTAHWNFADSD